MNEKSGIAWMAYRNRLRETASKLGCCTKGSFILSRIDELMEEKDKSPALIALDLFQEVAHLGLLTGRAKMNLPFTDDVSQEKFLSRCIFAFKEPQIDQNLKVKESSSLEILIDATIFPSIENFIDMMKEVFCSFNNFVDEQQLCSRVVDLGSKVIHVKCGNGFAFYDGNAGLMRTSTILFTVEGQRADTQAKIVDTTLPNGFRSVVPTCTPIWNDFHISTHFSSSINSMLSVVLEAEAIHDVCRGDHHLNESVNECLHWMFLLIDILTIAIQNGSGFLGVLSMIQIMLAQKGDEIKKHSKLLECIHLHAQKERVDQRNVILEQADLRELKKILERNH